jgi:hypothetical protein
MGAAQDESQWLPFPSVASAFPGVSLSPDLPQPASTRGSSPLIRSTVSTYSLTIS